jgi:hypothetical protein
VGAYRKPVAVVTLVLVALGLGAAILAGIHGSGGSSMSSSTTTVLSGSEDGAAGRSAAAAPSASSVGAASATELGRVVPAEGPDIIRTGSLALSVRKGRLLEVFDAVTSDAASEGGFVADSSTAEQNRKAPSASLVLRVPSERFTQLMLAVSTLGKVESQQVQGQDVTGQLVNLSARITNLQDEEQALRKLVQAAGSIPNILKVQNELFTVESEIEQLSAQQASLDNQTTYATLTVNLVSSATRAAVKPKPRGENTLSRGVKLAWHNLAVAVRAVVLGVGWAFPLLVAAALAYVVWRLRRRRGMTSPSPAGP